MARHIIAEARELADQGQHYLPPTIRLAMLALCDQAEAMQDLLERLELAADSYAISPSETDLEAFLGEVDRILIEADKPFIVEGRAA